MLSGIQYITGQISKLFWGETEYILDLGRIGIIWFSDNPNEFMPAANILRLIRNRLRNPQMQFYYVYSSKCLSAEALDSLEVFAKFMKLILIDFDIDLLADNTPLDQDIFDIATNEIAHTLTNKGGNLGSASDGVRSMERLLEICANYIDCDIDFDFSQLPRFIRVKAPVIIPGRILNFGFKAPSLSNSFVGVAVTSEDDLRLHPDAKQQLIYVKETIRGHYHRPNPNALLTEFTGTPSLTAMSPTIKQFIIDLFHESQGDIFKYRRLLSNTTPMELSHKLYKESVMKYSGPDAWYFLFAETIASCDGMQIDFMLEIFNEELVKASEKYNGLADCIFYNSNPEQNIEGQPKSDLSWTPYGKSKLRERSQKIDEGATVLQKYARGFLARNS